MTAPVLVVNGLRRSFGGVVAIDDLTLEVGHGEVLGVIGPNGAGKSTLVGLVCGALPASGGTVSLAGQDVTGLDAAHRARLGVGRTHQIPRPFDRMTVMDNLLLAAGSVPKGRSVRQRERDCRDILGRTGLDDQAQTRAGGLTLLRRKRLELARALALSPRILMLDEIGAGLVESETAELIELIEQLRHECDAMLVIEHVMDVITSCCDRTAVLDFGKLIAIGPTRKVLADPTVAAVYLGTASEKHRDADADADIPDAAEDSNAAIGPLRLKAKIIAPLVDTDYGSSHGSSGSRQELRGTPSGPLLEVAGVSHSYGGLRALRDVDLTVGRGEVVALLGANGAGKTTLTRVVAGVLRAETGTVTFDGQDTTALRADRVTALGLAQCLEGRRIFGTLSVEENLILGAGPAAARDRAERLDSVYSIFPALAERRHRSGTAMSGGQQQMLAIGRALMSAPKLVVLDEVSLGLAPIAVDRLYEALEAIAQSGVSMILVEQNIGRGLALASRAYVLAQGRVALSGTTDEIAADPALRSLYVGDTADA